MHSQEIIYGISSETCTSATYINIILKLKVERNNIENFVFLFLTWQDGDSMEGEQVEVCCEKSHKSISRLKVSFIHPFNQQWKIEIYDYVFIEI